MSARDIRSTVGSNLATLQKESGGLDPWTSFLGQLKAALLRSKAVQVPLQDAWKVPYLSHLLGARLKCYYSADMKEEKHLAVQATPTDTVGEVPASACQNVVTAGPREDKETQIYNNDPHPFVFDKEVSSTGSVASTG